MVFHGLDLKIHMFQLFGIVWDFYPSTGGTGNFQRDLFSINQIKRTYLPRQHASYMTHTSCNKMVEILGFFSGLLFLSMLWLVWSIFLLNIVIMTTDFFVNCQYFNSFKNFCRPRKSGWGRGYMGVRGREWEGRKEGELWSLCKINEKPIN